MAIGTGLSAQLGVKAETTYGTPVVVDRFFEFESEAIAIDIAKVDAPLLGGGRFLRADRTKTFLRGAGGPINFGPVMNKNFGLIFGSMASLIAAGSGLGPLMAGLLFDHYGNYDVYLWIGVVGTLISAWLIFGLPGYPDWAKDEDAAFA